MYSNITELFLITFFTAKILCVSFAIVYEITKDEIQTKQQLVYNQPIYLFQNFTKCCQHNNREPSTIKWVKKYLFKICKARIGFVCLRIVSGHWVIRIETIYVINNGGFLEVLSYGSIQR